MGIESSQDCSESAGTQGTTRCSRRSQKRYHLTAIVSAHHFVAAQCRLLCCNCVHSPGNLGTHHRTPGHTLGSENARLRARRGSRSSMRRTPHSPRVAARPHARALRSAGSTRPVRRAPSRPRMAAAPASANWRPAPPRPAEQPPGSAAGGGARPGSRAAGRAARPAPAAPTLSPPWKPPST